MLQREVKIINWQKNRKPLINKEIPGNRWLPGILFMERDYGDLGFELPFEYKSAFLPLVAIWYIVTELGSIIENVARLGAPVPKFLISSLKKLKEKADEDK